MARIKQKPIITVDWNTSARASTNPTPPSALPAPGPNVLLAQPPQPTNSISLPDAPSVSQAIEEQPESIPAVLPSSDSRLAPTENLRTCQFCNEVFPGSHLQAYRDHVERSHADMTAGIENDSDEGSPTDRLTTPPESERSETDRIPLPPAYSATEVQLYPKVHDEDEETEEAQQPQQRFCLPALTSISEFQDSVDAGENGSIDDHMRALGNLYEALYQTQDEYLEHDKAVKTSQYPPTLSLEDEQDMVGGRVRGVLRETIKPFQKVANPRAKPTRSDDPEKWYPTNQFQLEQDRTEGAVYGYIVKEGAKDIGHQDPIGQRARGAGDSRDLRARQPQRGAVRDDDSGDESGLNAVDVALLEGGRGKREKKPSDRVQGTNSRASSVDARAKPPRKNAKSRLADLGADHPSAADTLDSTNRWVDDVDADDGSGASDDESGVTKPHKGPQQSYLDPKTKKNAAGKKSKNVSNNGELDDDEAAAAKLARSQKRSEGAKMGWAKRKEALAAKESTQASINGDLDEGSQSELAKPDPNDASDANSAIKAAPKKKAKQMIQLENGTWIEKPSAATINMRRRWQKKREAEAKGLPPPKIGRYKKTDVILADSSSTPADFNDQENNEVLAAVDGANNKRKQSEQNDDDDRLEDADKSAIKGKKKPRKNKQELSNAMVIDDDNDTVNDDTLMDEDNEEPTSTKKGKRSASADLAGPPRKKQTTARNTESLASSDEEDETDDEMLLDPSSSPKKHTKKKGGQNKKKGTYIKFFQRKPEEFVVPPQDLIVFMAGHDRRPPSVPRLGQFPRRGTAANRDTSIPPVFVQTDLPDPQPLTRQPVSAPNPVVPAPGAGTRAVDDDGDVDMDSAEANDETTDIDESVQVPRIPSGFQGAPPAGRPMAPPVSLSSRASSTPRTRLLDAPYRPGRFDLPGQRSMDSGGSRDLMGFPTMDAEAVAFLAPQPALSPFHPRWVPPQCSLDPPTSSGSEFAAPPPRPRPRVNERPVLVDRPAGIPGRANPGLANPSQEAPRTENQDPAAARKSGRARKAPVRNDMVESSAIPSSSPPVRRPQDSRHLDQMPLAARRSQLGFVHPEDRGPNQKVYQPGDPRGMNDGASYYRGRLGRDGPMASVMGLRGADEESIRRTFPNFGANLARGGGGPATAPPRSSASGREDDVAANPAAGGQGSATLPPVSARAASGQRDDVVANSGSGDQNVSASVPSSGGGGPATVLPVRSARRRRDDVAATPPASSAAPAAARGAQAASASTPAATPAGTNDGSAGSTPAPELAQGESSNAEAQGPATAAPAPTQGRKYKPSGQYTEKNGRPNWEYDKKGEHITQEEIMAMIEAEAADAANSTGRARRAVQPPKRFQEDEAAQSPAARSAKRPSDSEASGQTKRPRTSGPNWSGGGPATLSIRNSLSAPAPARRNTPGGSYRPVFQGLAPGFVKRKQTPSEADRGDSADTSKAGSSKASGTKGKVKSKGRQSTQASTSARPSQTPSRGTPAPSQQPQDEESTTACERKSKRSTQGKPPRRLDDEVGEFAEGQRESRSPSGKDSKSGYQAIQNMRGEAIGSNYGAPGAMGYANPSEGTQQGGAGPGSATKKNKGKAPRKSDAKSTKDVEMDSPVASIEENDLRGEDEMNSSQKTVVDPEVAEALAKREEARKAKSEKMKAITKARWASGEMHTVMEKKKANNALKKAALNAGGNTPIAIAPAPLPMAPKPVAPAPLLAKKTSVSQSPAPITPTMGSFSGNGKAKPTTKPEAKKEPRTKQLAKESTTHPRRSNSRGLSNEVDGARDTSSDEEGPRKLTEYEMFLQISTPGVGGVLTDSDTGRPTRAKSIAGAYEGRRSGRGGSLGGVGMERNNSDDGVIRGTPNHASSVGGRKGKTGPNKLSVYEQFQMLSSPTSGGSPLPRGRRPAALRAKQTFQSFSQDEDAEEEETVPYAGPPVHLGHSRNNSGVSLSGSQSGKKGKGKGISTAMPPPKMAKVKKEEVELGEEEDGESSDEEGEKKLTEYDRWQELIRNGGETTDGDGKRKRVAARKSDVAK